jgi:hypothetical protein
MFLILYVSGAILGQIKRGCMVTNGAPHIPLSGSACNACLLYCAADSIEFASCVQVEHLAELLCSCKVERKRKINSNMEL